MDGGGESDVGRAVALSLVGECRRDGCLRPRARNPRTHALHEFCSLWCAASPHNKPVTQDHSMDLAIALEMSRLQMIEDTVKRQKQYVFKSRSLAKADRRVYYYSVLLALLLRFIILWNFCEFIVSFILHS